MSIKLNIDKSVLGDSEGDVVAEVSGKTVGECLNYMVKQQPTLKKSIFDKNGNLYPDNLIRVNGKYVLSKDRKFIPSKAVAKSVKNGDEIEIIKWRC